IARHMEQGLSAMQASLKGAQEITFTLISLTLSLVAVLITLLFMSDVIVRLLREFAITLSVAILLSLFISLTSSPMMCARLLKAETSDRFQGLQHWLGKQFEALVAAYDASLQWVLRHQVLTLIIAGATLLFTALLYIAIPKGFFPQQDTGLV